MSGGGLFYLPIKMIKRKLKPCKECSRVGPIWSKGRCQKCASKTYSKPKHRTNKRKSEEQEYSIKRKAFIKNNPLCVPKLPGCTKKATQVHHKAKRDGVWLLKQEYWLATCHECHDTIEHKMSMEEAVEKGLRVKRKPGMK